jgi:hypothetical protein
MTTNLPSASQLEDAACKQEQARASVVIVLKGYDKMSLEKPVQRAAVPISEVGYSELSSILTSVKDRGLMVVVVPPIWFDSSTNSTGGSGLEYFLRGMKSFAGSNGFQRVSFQTLAHGCYYAPVDQKWQ